MYVGVCVSGVDMLVGAPSTLSMSGLSLVGRWQFMCGHVHPISQSGVVFSCCMSFWLPAFVSV